MGRHLLRVLVSIGLLVILAWVGIVLFAKLEAGVGVTALIVMWAVALVLVVGSVIWSVLQARRARLERRPEETRGR